MRVHHTLVCCLALFVSVCGNFVFGADEANSQPETSFYNQVRPILQANCHGCHQPAKSLGDYVMTDFQKLLDGGESGLAAVVPGKPEESYLIEQITPTDGEALMPRKADPLIGNDIKIITQWIKEGAKDDTPASAKQRYDRDHPPVYTRQPVITSLDFSPDGSLLAIGGFHEVLLFKGDGSERVGRLVGVSAKIQSVAFSPDGKKLAVTGGLPGRMGEIQVWDVAHQKLLVSTPVTYDTVYGGSWSPDGKLIAFGCTDSSVRAIDAETGEEKLFQGAHSDWSLGTIFSTDGEHLASVGRDMTVKLIEVATERFVDNITSITPGALKGGVQAIARHPERDEIVVGGSDGIAKVYRMERLTKRVIGDDANLIRVMPEIGGRIFGLDVSADGKLIAACNSLDGSGEVQVYSYEFDSSLPDDIKAIHEKLPQQWNADERKKIEEYNSKDVKLISRTAVSESSMYAVAFHPGGKTLAAAGGDGIIRLIDAATGNITKAFEPAPISQDSQTMMEMGIAQLAAPEPTDLTSERLPKGRSVTKLIVEPDQITLTSSFAYSQILVTGLLDDGSTTDLTRQAKLTLSTDVATVGASGVVRPVKTGEATLGISIAGHSAKIPVTVASANQEEKVDYIRDVNPVLTRLGCNQGTCHGSKDGKNGFKLSLRGYDAIYDVRALTDDHGSRRVNLASPDNSLMLLKGTGSVPHVGQQLMQPGEPYYEIIRNWIADAAQLNRSSSRVAKITVTPENPVVQEIGQKQQVRVLAHYQDGSQRDVTQEAFVTSGDTEIAAVNKFGIMTALRRGESPVLCRFEGAYAATTLTVMGDREGFVWQQPETWSRIDELAASKWQRMKIQPSGLSTDAEFIRRIYLDLTGVPPTADQVRAFMADATDVQVKRASLIDQLIGSTEYIEFWTNKWADLLQVNGKFLGRPGAVAFRKWIRDHIEKNTPYDQFVTEVVTADGSNKENPAASYYKILRDPADTMENTTHLFLAVRFNCNKCHDHPFERWTQDQYYETAAFFAQVGLKRDPNEKGNIGGTAVEGAKPLYEVVYDKPEGEIKHDRTGEVTAPEFPYEAVYKAPEAATRRQQLAEWMTSSDNQYFARSYVNRLWGYMFGIGIIEPIDDIRAGNPPTNPELLDYLEAEFIQSGFNVRHVIQLICKSRTYQLSIEQNRWNADDKINYSHALARRLPAEVLYDSVYRSVGAQTKIPGVPPGTRAAELPDVSIKIPGGFLNTFGRPPRESSCECERTNEMQLGPVMALISGPTIADAIVDGNNDLHKLVKEEADDQKMINEIFLRILNRPATESEVAATLKSMQEIDPDHLALQQELKERETWWTETKPKLETKRQQMMVVAQQKIDDYKVTTAEEVAKKTKEREDRIAAAETKLKTHEDTVPAKLTAWEAKQDTTGWTLLDPAEMKSSMGAEFEKRDDLSIFVSGKNGKGTYTIVAETEATNITGIRLEVLSDEKLPGKGPGRAMNGNFVLTELSVSAASKANPESAIAVKLEKALADKAQDGYAIATAIDGNTTASNNGWAMVNGVGSTHWATFEVKEPITNEGGTRLVFTMNQQYNDGTHSIGKFRLAITTAKKPVGLGLSEEVQPILATVPEERTDEQKAKLLDFFRRQDQPLQNLVKAVATAKQPLPADPKLVALEKDLTEVSQPIREDPNLVQLKKDLTMSETQTGNKRLTMAQDLAWALINSPAFLFNH
ncbi:MAG: DUF1553 domain-containing protein [Planctomycetaceae bacterium]|nr:DUF1553 domain-containing protein [Planctomycetaceae bacterium]